MLGRAGRGDEEGVAIVQTVDPDSNLIRLAANQDYDAFYSGEIGIRKMMIYPPFCDIAQVSVSATSKADAEQTCKDIFDALKNGAEGKYSDIPIRVLGPSPAATPRINNKYRYRLIIKTKNNRRFRALLREATNQKCPRDTSVSVDINPETII